MATSFICEHSAEFSIVPHMKSLLEKEFKYVVPIFPWLSRELSGKSKMVHKNEKFHILVLFPRRPKTNTENKLFVTINRELVAFKEVGQSYGITVLAGCPKATDFWQLSNCSESVWIDIGPQDLKEYLISIDSIEAEAGKLRLKDEKILNSVTKGKQHTMKSFEEFVREARYTQPTNFFGGRYKPVYFLMKNQ